MGKGYIMVRGARHPSWHNLLTHYYDIIRAATKAEAAGLSKYPFFGLLVECP